MQTYIITKISEQRGTPRLWLEGSRLESAGFSPACRYSVQIDAEAKRLTLQVAEQGERLVSRKERAGKVLPIIDICNSGMLGMFSGMERLRVVFMAGVLHILPLASEARRQDRVNRLKEKLASGEPLAVGSVSSGVGVLSLAVHDGLKDAGVSSRLAMACDIEQDYLTQASENNPAWNASTVMISAPMQELAFDTWAVSRLPALDFLECGTPCTAHSNAGRAKKGLTLPEDDVNVGHLVASLLAIVAATNPACLLVECVPGYMTSASFAILRNQLREWGYSVQAQVLSGKEFNVIENRERMALVAVTEGIEFDFSAVARPEPAALRLGDYLDPVAPDSPVWSEMAYLKEKELRDKAAGKCFAMQIFDEDSTYISTIGRGYAKVRSTEPKLRHPTNPALLRQLSPEEHCRVKHNDPVLIRGMCATRAHEVMGQSVLSVVFRAVVKALACSVLAWFASLACSPDINEEFTLAAA